MGFKTFQIQILKVLKFYNLAAKLEMHLLAIWNNHKTD